MDEAEKQLDADVIFVMGEPFHLKNLNYSITTP